MDNGSIVESNLPIVEVSEAAITDKEENEASAVEAPIVETPEAETVDKEENQETGTVDGEESPEAVLLDEEEGEDDMQDATVRVPAISATKAGVE